ncbi:3-keto-5-aminohexanoate cleavage protein [Bosea caraganae]|uniref:3-keto-5-aminohexanoate cleavage protein n=1 Tax=Bosea caraganae TaxID=2763117 RepID=A0A370KYT7_9HYPH|nr:3-keto-5-aminohexanoate cleavage protein [Bosea caraganae]RDJ20096.1 3-keto-5-aminohexanoate cleavage protein [Bosea caraganae]RDJ24808.1 3-keto-5-aminohexanoate cleavage protein [Bosea caraganae]
MGRKTILTCAVTGNLTTREQHPGLPVTPEEIARAAIEAGNAGAAVAHLHARDVTTGKGSMDREAFREIVGRIRDSGSDIIINLSTGEGGRFMPSEDEPSVAAPGTTLTTPERRVAHVEDLKPEICTLDFNTMFSGSAVVINTPRNLEIMARRIYAAGTLPEIEIFDSGDLHLCKSFIERGIIKVPALFQIVLGVRYSAVANPETLFYFQSQLPKDSIWAAFGIGRHEFPMLAQAWLLGGHVRVGLEDNVYISKGVLARDNAELVEKGVSLVENLGGSIATPQEARAILGLA